MRDYFLVERELDQEARRSAPVRSALQDRVDAAERRLEAARLLREGCQDHAALLLYLDGGLLLARAFVDQQESTQEQSAGPPSPETTIARVMSIVERERRSMPPKALQDLTTLLAGDATEIDQLPRREAALRAETADAITRWLAGLVVLRSRRELRAIRTLRLSIAVLALVAIPVARVIWAVSPTNISWHKAVTGSSATPDSSLPGIVDDDYYFTAYKSLEQDFPWVTVDLGRRYLLSDAEVFSRQEQSVPLVFEISNDNITFRTVATRTEPFVPGLPWIVKPLQIEGRYVRVRVLRRSVLALGEIAVYGRRALH